MKNTIKNVIKESIRKSILNIPGSYGTKVYLNEDNKVRSLLVPNEEYETGNMENVLCYIPPMRDTFKYENAGRIKDNVSKDDFNDLIRDYADEEYISMDESLKFWENNSDYKMFYNYSYKDTFEKSLNNYIEKYLNELNIIVEDDLKVKINNL